MDNITKALDLYYEAVKKGVADVNSQLKNKTQQTIEEYEKQIEDITASVNESNLKIKDMQTAKTTASKEYKKTLTTMIAQERETIAALNLQIKEIKAQISDAKAEMKELVEGYELIDDGLSGTSFDSPAFNRMIDDIENKKINMVITKDTSRLGRNNEEFIGYTERYFPEHNVRYISILDGIDTYLGYDE